MRKLLFSMAGMIAVACCTTNADAFDVKNKFMASALGGLSVPVGDFGDDDTSNVSAGAARIGPNFGIAVEYGVTEVVQLGARFSFDRFVIDEAFLYQTLADTVSADTAFVDGHWSIVEYFGIYAKALMLPGKDTRPFVRAGLFLGKPSLTIGGAEESWSGDYDVSLGLEAALGVTHWVSPQFGIGLEARFAHLNPSESDDDVEAAPAFRSAGAYGPTGVRDPGGNLQWLAVDGYVTYGF